MMIKTLSNLKRTVSGILALMMTASMATVLPASAEEEQPPKYPYAIFAADNQGGITLELDSLTLNGNGYSNGAFKTTAQYSNINGNISVPDEIEADETITDGEDSDNSFDVSKDMIFIHNKLMDNWFTENCQTYDEDYSFSDMNINLNTPVYVTGRLSYDGNVSLNTAIGAVSDVNLTGGNLNGNNAVIYSKFGDIKITDSQASMNGLIYAPFGTVTIDCDNFNMDGIIIAQNVVIDSYGANINYNSSWAEFVGTETEELSWTFDDWQYLADTDEDGLPNLIEKEIGTDQYDPDSDGDLLPDGYEVLTLGTDPMKPDTDDNDISDYDEDFDSDGLSNGQEYELGTKPYVEDTDGDNLLDGDEINTYFTNPLGVDTDEDGLNDDDEIYFGTDPNDPDSDDNGILDGKEKRFQTFIHKVENEDCVITEIKVSMEATGNLQNTTTVESVMNKDMLCTDVVGLVGEPFSIETSSEFDNATLTYVIDKDKLGDTKFDNLLFLWYNESEDEFVELDTILDEENSTVSINTTHFSKYMLVDQVAWFEAWKMASLYFEDGYEPIASVICYDCSGSMYRNDESFLHNIYNNDGTISYSYSTCYRKLAIDNFIDSMKLTDKTALISFESSADLVSGFSDDKVKLKNLVKPYNSGGTNVRAAVRLAIDELEDNGYGYSKHIILLSDGDVNLDINVSNGLVDELLVEAKNKDVKIHTIGLGYGANNQKLKDCAEYTGGVFFVASTADELDEIYMDLSKKNHFDLKELADEDEDGLPDEFEVSGLVVSNAQIYYTDPNNPDTDGDDIPDGKEICIDNSKSHFVIKKNKNGGNIEYSTIVFNYNSDPMKKYCYDNNTSIDYHSLKLIGTELKCTNCAYKIDIPDLQDDTILDKDDFNRVLALEYTIAQYKTAIHNNLVNKPHCEYAFSLLAGEIDKIRMKDCYDGKYDLCDKNGKYVPITLNSKQYSSIPEGMICTVNYETVNRDNYRLYSFWYGGLSSNLCVLIGVIQPYLGAGIQMLQDITSPQTYNCSDLELFKTICFSTICNIGGTYISKKYLKEKSAEYDAYKYIYKQAKEQVYPEDEYKVAYGDAMLTINIGYQCQLCKNDPEHREKMKNDRTHFPYTNYDMTRIWMRNNKVLFCEQN